MVGGPIPLLSLGTLNRLRGTILIPLRPELNISATQLGRAGIKLAVEGNINDMLAQMAGQVQSQNVYSPAMVSSDCGTVPCVSRADTSRSELKNEDDALAGADQIAGNNARNAFNGLFDRYTLGGFVQRRGQVVNLLAR